MLFNSGVQDNFYETYKTDLPEKGMSPDRPRALLMGPYAGLEITAGQRTMFGLIVDLTGQTFVLPVMLTGQNSVVLKMK